MKLLKIDKQTNNKYLNMYKLTLENKVGNIKEYFVASRREKDKIACVTKDHEKADGVMILPITEDDEIVMVKQYRPAIDDYLYELPAGIIDEGEDLETAAKRELFEETGLTGYEMEVLVKPSYVSVGLTDETTGVVKMKVRGEISIENLEDDEELEVVKIKISDAKKFVKENNVSIKGAIILSML